MAQFAGMATHWTLGDDAAHPHGIAAFWGVRARDTSLSRGTTTQNRMRIDIQVAGEPLWDMAEREQLIRGRAAGLVTAGGYDCQRRVLR
jgi:hypothetical protein